MNTRATNLAGSLRIAPGKPCPHGLRNSRQDWASRLTVGMPALDLPARLGSLYSLCGASHWLCARMALAQAQGHTLGDAHAAATLQQETLREHVQRICLDWPRQLCDGGLQTHAASELQATLRQCPLFTTGAACTPQALQAWLATHLLGMEPLDWLLRWEAKAAQWLTDWCMHTALNLPRLLLACHQTLHHPQPHSPLLQVHAHADDLQQLALDMEQQPGFVLRPQWRQGCAETGSWSRLNDRQEATLTPWLRLGARVAELVRLALPDQPGRSGTQWLSMGSTRTGEHSALAWVEMARGLLLHHVRVDAAGERVLTCRVLAPTEWNFHASGSVAQAVATLPRQADDAVRHTVDGLVSAWDPCLAYALDLEDNHA